MKKFINVTNQWYESLSDIKKLIFFMTVVIIPNSFMFLPKPYCVISITWALIICIWRISFKLLK